MSKEFSINQGDSVVVVIAKPSVMGDDVRDFTLALNRTLRKDPSLTNLSNITSIYDIYYQLLQGQASVAQAQLTQLKNITSLANFLEFGIPRIYVSQWAGLVSAGPLIVNQTQVVEYNKEANASTWNLVHMQTPPAYQAIAFGYQNMFYQSWNMTFTAPTYNQVQLLFTPNSDGPLLRAENVTKGYPGLGIQPPYYNVTYPYFSSLPLDAQTQGVFLGTIKFFNLYPVGSIYNDWDDFNALRAYTLNTFNQAAQSNYYQSLAIAQIYDCFVTLTAFACPVSPPSFSSYASLILRTSNMLTYPIQPTSAVYSQFVSAKNDTMLMILDFRSNGADPRNSIQQIRSDASLAGLVTSQSLTVYVTGAPAFNYDIESETVRDVERIDPITVILIIVIIGLFFTSITAPFVPVSAIGLSVGVSFGLVYVIGSLFTSIHFLVLTLLPVAMFGAGSDYCIFLVSRYAEERRRGRDKNDAVEQAVTWAGESIATSGATVVIAFGSLAIASFGMLRSIGLAVMLGISVALLVSITLVPAALSLLGDRLFWPRRVDKPKAKKGKGESYYRRAAKFTAQHSKLIILVALVFSLPTTSTVLTSHTSHDFISQVPNSLDSKAGYNTMSAGFGPGAVTPTYTIVQTPAILITDNWINITALKSFSLAENSTSTIPGVSKVYGLTHPSGEPIPYFAFDQLDNAQQQQMIRSMKPFLGSDGKSAMVWAVLSSEPYSDQAIQTLDRIRTNNNVLRSQDPLLGASSMFVGGATAGVADLVNSSAQDYLNMTSLVMVGVSLVLLVALGSVFTPLRLIFTILLSVSWAMAGVLFVSKTFMGSELIWILPIMLLVIMVGLGLDYDIFLVTRIREHVVGGSKDEEAIENAVEHTGGIITASGLVTAGAFGTMMLSQIPMLQQLGLGIFIVVLLDASLIRIYLVPSIMMHMKRLNWWAPGPLRRVPAQPQEKLAPLSPRRKGAVSLGVLIMIGLGAFGAYYYSTHTAFQSTVNQTVKAALERTTFEALIAEGMQTVLTQINIGTALLLAFVSCFVMYVLIRGRLSYLTTLARARGALGPGQYSTPRESLPVECRPPRVEAVVEPEERDPLPSPAEE